MTDRLLARKKIAVLLESEFIPEEIEAYQQRFPEIGATVHFMSRLWNQPSIRFLSDVVEEGMTRPRHWKDKYRRDPCLSV